MRKRNEATARGVAVAAAVLVVSVTALSGCSPRSDGEGASYSEASADKLYEVSVTVTNNSDFPLTLSSSTLGHGDGDDGGHWGDRPTDLAPHGGATTASAYAAVQGQAISLTYIGGGGKVVLVAQDPAIGSNNTNGTKSTPPLTVNSSIWSGRDATADFVIVSGQ